MTADNTKHYTIATALGKSKIENYYRLGKTLPLTHMGFGGIDGDDVNYQRPSEDMLVVPNEWAKIGLERHPDEGFIGGGATIHNRDEQYRGKWICNVGIYDEDGDLILISALHPVFVESESSVVSAYPIDIYASLVNAEHVTVVTDTHLTHPTHDEMDMALGALEGRLSQPATTERLGLAELATQSEVDSGLGGDRVVTAETLNKKGLIANLKAYADQIKSDIMGGLPPSALDTIQELAAAFEEAGDAIQGILSTLSTKLSISAFNEYKESIQEQLQSITDSKWAPVDASTTEKGITQLVDATNSSRKDAAATPNALSQVLFYSKRIDRGIRSSGVSQNNTNEELDLGTSISFTGNLRIPRYVSNYTNWATLELQSDALVSGGPEWELSLYSIRFLKNDQSLLNPVMPPIREQVAERRGHHVYKTLFIPILPGAEYIELERSCAGASSFHSMKATLRFYEVGKTKESTTVPPI